MQKLSPSPDLISHPLPLPRLAHVDGLRALAVLLVVVFHAWPRLAPGGFIGVDVFFVISGFVITRQIAREMESGSFSYGAFLGRRVRRLLPAAFVCSLLVSIAAAVVLLPDALVAFSKSLIAVWTMTANFQFFGNTGYFDAPAAEAPMLHMWSLAVEDQFYLTWPLLLLLLFRKFVTRGRILVPVLALALVSLVHSQMSATSNPSLAFYLPFSRAFELLSGCALALCIGFIKAPRLLLLALLEVAGLALVVGSAFMLDATVPFPGLAVVPTIVGSVLLIAPGLFGATPVARLLSLRPVVLGGQMSYSIYLYHWPPLALATSWLGRAPDATEAAVLIAASLVLAALSWRWVEQDLTQRLALASRPARSLLGLAAGTTACFSLLALAGIASRGWPQRLDAPAQAVYQAASEGNPLRARCDGYELAFSHSKECTFGKPLEDGHSYDLAIFGDSNADHFVPMIATLAHDAGLSGRQITQSACAPLLGAAFDRPASIEKTCEHYQETVLKFLDRNPHLKLAILSWAWTRYPEPKPNALAREAGSTGDHSFASFAESTIALFRKRGIKVLVVGQVPHFATFSLRCLMQAARNDREEVDCGVARADVDRVLEPFQSAIERIDQADDDVSFLDMRSLLCTKELCSAFKDEVLLYRDHTHLNAVGAAYLARFASLPKLGK